MKKPKPPAYLLAALVAMLVVHFLVPIARIMGFPWRLLGVVPFLLGTALTVRALQLFKLHKTTPEPFGTSRALVTSGPYGVTRNPMYLGILLMFSGIACLLGTAAPWLVVLMLGGVFDVNFIRREEGKMETKFGDAYKQYKTQVRRWI